MKSRARRDLAAFRSLAVFVAITVLASSPFPIAMSPAVGAFQVNSVSGASVSRQFETALICPDFPSALPTPAIQQPEASPVHELSLLEQAPAGVDQVLVASAVMQEMPAGPAELTLERGELLPGDEVSTRRAVGNVLIHVTDGSLILIVDDTERSIGAGESALVNAGQAYALLNESRRSASVVALRIAELSASGTDRAFLMMTVDDEFLEPGEAGVKGDPQLERVEPGASPAAAVTIPQLLDGGYAKVLFVGEVELPEAAPKSVFIACLAWSSPLKGTFSHPGPVVIRMEEGVLLPNDYDEVYSGECRLIEAGWTYFMDAEMFVAEEGAPNQRALMFGIIPEQAPLWIEGARNEDDISYETGCGVF